MHNRGNAPQTFTLKWQDPGDELKFNPIEITLDIGNGQSGEAKFQAAPRRRALMGGQKSHRFSVQVSAPVGEVQPLSGELVSQARFSIWLPLILLLLCAGLAAAAGIWLWWGWQEQERMTAAAATARAEATEITARADSDKDGLTDLEEAKLGTDPSEADTDGDGLTDKEEVDGGKTKATIADTDGDGLNDGDEITEGSNPEVRDSDGDTLPDGAEVHGWEKNGQLFHTSPLKDDTDGDGLKDNVDADPGNLPTPTFTPPPTSTSTARQLRPQLLIQSVQLLSLPG